MNTHRDKLMNANFIRLFGAILLFISSGLLYGCKKEDVNNPGSDDKAKVNFWLTDVSQNILFTEQPNITTSAATNGIDMITVNDAQTYQTMDGFGCALTGGSAYHLYNMSAATRKQLLTELFDHSGKNIGISYLRISIGASDLDAKVFSYDDLAAGETDVDMLKFSLAEDKKYLIPVLKEIIAIFPEIKLLGSPWSAPVWMKTNNKSIGGSLRTQYYPAYAKYFVKYIQEMKNEGITIDAITIQNEPLYGGNNPSMVMQAIEQAAFIKNNLGPAFAAAGITTKIIVYDHNADRTDYPITVMNDPDAKKYVDGSAFHLYGGEINALTLVHNAHPDKNLYFTEQWVGSGSDFGNNIKEHVSLLTIGATRNWCRAVLEWNLAANLALEPHTDGGCTQCLGAVTIQGDAVTRNPAYYIMAHGAKFVRPGSKRIETNVPDNLPNVAFVTPEGKKVIIVVNTGNSKKFFNIKVGDKIILASLSPGAAGTFVW